MKHFNPIHPSKLNFEKNYHNHYLLRENGRFKRSEIFKTDEQPKSMELKIVHFDDRRNGNKKKTNKMELISDDEVSQLVSF